MALRLPGSSSAASGRAVKLLTGLVAASVGTGVLAAGLVLPGVVLAGRAAKGTVEAFNSLPAELETQPLSQQSRILYADGSPMATFYYENRTEVPLDAVAPVMQQAIVAIEDSRFWQHGGVDPKGMGRAFVNNASGDDVQGASTLTQQWIKNVRVEKAVSALPPDATTAQRQAAFASATQSSGLAGYARKLREVKLAIAAEKKLSKQQILDDYLNITSFGDGQYGIEAASRHYFDRSAKDLDLPDAALMAGVVQNPIILDPVSHPDAALARRNTVLGRMLAQGLIDQAQHDQAVAVPLAAQLHVQPIQNGCESAGASGFFCDYAVKQFRDDDAFGGTKDQRLQLLYRGGLSITTTLDPVKQRVAVDTVNAAVPAGSSSTPTLDLRTMRPTGGRTAVGASIVSVEPGTGKIAAMAQDRTYSTSPDAPDDATSINFNTDQVEGGSRGFQVGSSYKPFTLATWLANGHSLNETINAPTSPHLYNITRDFHASCANIADARGYNAHNSEGDEAGPMSVLSATYNSVNTAYLEMARQLDLCQIRDTAVGLGVHRADGKDLSVSPSSVLGPNEIAPLTMASAYAAFAAQGTWCAPTAIAAVTDADGNALAVPGPQCKQAVSADVANGVTAALQQVIVQGTAAGQGLAGGRVAAGKTGTTNNSVAAWFSGYTPQLATSVWLGTPAGSQSLNGGTVAGRRLPRKVYGATLSAPMWKTYMDQALAGVPNAGFIAPPPAIAGGSAPSASSPSATRRTPSAPRSTTRSPRTARPAPSSSAAPPSSKASAPAPASSQPPAGVTPGPPADKSTTNCGNSTSKGCDGHGGHGDDNG
jgi:membrane peptidoglycan carboxypeptidase